MRILLALLCCIFTLSSLQADIEKSSGPRFYSHYDKITKDLYFLGEAYIAPGYLVYLFTGKSDEFYRCYLVCEKHKKPNILCLIDYELASFFFPFLLEFKDKYDGPKLTEVSSKPKD